MNLNILRLSDVGKSEKRPAQKESNCDNVCRVRQVKLKATYGKCVAKSLWKYIQTVGEKRNIRSCLKRISRELWGNIDWFLPQVV